MRDPSRIRAPLLRDGAGHREVAWDAAISATAAGLRSRNPEEIGIVLSPASPNEALFLGAQLARSILRTANVDFPGRHATEAMRILSSRQCETLCTVEQLEGADLIVAIGMGDGDRSPQLVPVIWRAIGRGVPVVAIDDWRTDLFSEAALILTPRPHADHEWIEAVGRSLAPRFAVGGGAEPAARDALEPDAIEALTRMIIRAKRIAFVIDTASHGRMQDGRSVQALASLIVLLRGMKEWVGLLPIFERCNTLGALDMGAAPEAGAAPGAGLDLLGMIDAAEQGRLKAMLIAGDLDAWGLLDPAHVERALRGLEFLAVASSFPTSLTGIAHVVFPRPIPGEVEGSYTSTEGRVQTTFPQVASPAPQEWRLFSDLTRALGDGRTYATIGDVRAEIARALPDYAPLAAGEASFLRTLWDISPIALDAQVPVVAAQADDAHPFLLSVERTYLPYARETTLLRSPILRRESQIFPAQPHVLIHPEDAKGAALRDGGRALMRSPWGDWSARVLLRREVPKGRVVLPEVFHEEAAALIGERRIDALTGAALYPAVAVSLTAERR